MTHNKGYAFESDTEKRFMRLRLQKIGDALLKRSHRQPTSGAMPATDGDVVVVLDFLEPLGGILVECKDRKHGRGEGKSVSMLKEELDKARIEAARRACLCGFAFKVKSGQGGNRVPLFKGDTDDPMGLRWMAMPFSDYFRLLEYLRDLWDELQAYKDAEDPYPKDRGPGEPPPPDFTDADEFLDAVHVVAKGIVAKNAKVSIAERSAEDERRGPVGLVEVFHRTLKEERDGKESS